MQKIILYSFLLTLVITFFSCKQDNNSTDKKNLKTIAKIESTTNRSTRLNTAAAKSFNQVAIAATKKGKKNFFLRNDKVKLKNNEENEVSEEMYDGALAAEEFEIRKTKDPALGFVPKYRLIPANEAAKQSKIANANSRTSQTLSWIERGSNSDSPGPYGNSRPPGAVTSGRMRAIWVDLSDASGNTVWAGGIDGGIWKTTNFNTNPANWTPVSDFFSNLAVSTICQDPTNPSILYFGTGEKTFNIDAVRGGGVWKSTDHGVTFNLLANTASPLLFWNVSKILCDASGNVYCATIGSGAGLQRSNDKGATWTNISVSGVSSRYPDINISSTGRLHVCTGYYNSADANSVYRYTDNPSTVTSSTWGVPVTPFPASDYNTVLASSGNTIYALCSNSGFLVPTIYKSIDGGNNWAATAATLPTSGNNAFTNGAAWYCLSADVDPSNANNVIIGSLNCFKSTDGGNSFSQISNWATTTPGNYVHADQHIIKFVTSNNVLVGCDGGIFYSTNAGSSFSDRNANLRLKQFYSVAIHPTITDYFLAGAQDNGVHQFTNPGLSSSVEVTGGDGAFTGIHQISPLNQIGSYTYNQYRLSTDGGNTWTNAYISASAGQFINPFDYDYDYGLIYAAYNSNTYLSWTPPSISAINVISIPINGNIVSTVKVDPYSPGVIFIGSDDGPSATVASKILKVRNANTTTPSVTDMTAVNLPTVGYVSCINTGTSDQNLILTYASYGVQHVWISSDGGTTWVNITGNLPDMPVRWALFYPGSNTKAMIATEAGVWETTSINGSSTVWTANTTFPTVRTDMIRIRPSDGTVAAATHGRGLWTAIFAIPSTTWTGNSTSSWTDAGSWSNGVPDGGTNAIIPNVATKPIITSTQQVYNLTVNSSASVTVNNGGNLQILAGLSNSGTITGSGSTILATGNIAPITGTGTVSNFTLSNGATIDPASSVSITGTLTVNGTLIINGNLTLKSTSTSTANIGPITNGIISGNITVERYFSDRRSWRLLGIPFSSSAQTIKASWQEGATLFTQNPNPPYGTHITTFIGDPNAPNFDASKPGSSIRIYSGDNFNSDAAHTPNTTSIITSNAAYFLFVRGNRSIDLTNTSAHSAATLRISGTIDTGSISGKGVLGNAFSLIANPYPSPVDFNSIKAIAANSGINTFYLWDATMAGSNGVGQYRTITISGTAPNYTYTATPGSQDNNWRFIESGAAFLVPGTTSVSFTENTKTSSLPSSSLFRTNTSAAGTQPEIAMNLNIVNQDNSTSLADGVREIFDNSYSAAVDNDDAKKIEGFELNFGIVSNNQVLSVEKRPMPSSGDVITLQLSGMAQGNYQFEVEPSNLSPVPQFIYLRDNYLNTYTPVSATGNTTINFTITSDAASAGENRFSLVFTKGAIAPGGSLIEVYPNPVQGGSINLLMNNMPKGLYNVRLINAVGQTLLRTQINHAEGTSTETIRVNNVKGTYMIEVTKPDNSKFTSKIIIN